jgi:type IV pilus assembly protein PilP
MIKVLLLVAALCAWGAGCGGEKGSNPNPTASSAKPGQKQSIATAPTGTVGAKQEEAPFYVYNPAGRRDPFAPIIVKETKKARIADRPPLERFAVSEFKLSGIIWGGFGYNAMLEAPDGKGYFVRVGTVVGLNGGVIKKITQNSMIVEESFKTFTGESERKEIVIQLQRRQEEKL